MLYAEVILPFSFSGGVFTYSVPDGSASVAAGSRVRVNFRRKEMIGIVRGLVCEEPAYKVRPIVEVIDTEPLILPRQLELISFASDYYADSVGDMLKAILPSKIRSEDFSGVKVVAYRLSAASLKDELDTREKKKGQYRILMAFADSGEQILTLSRLVKYGAGAPALKKLCAEGVLERTEVPRDTYENMESGEALPLTERAADAVSARRPRVIFGLEEQASLIKELVGHYSKKGECVLVLMPSSDGQLIEQLWSDSTVKYFASDSVSSRTQTYLRLLKSPSSVGLVLGGRISVFLPFSNLGHIVVLDEHDERYRGQRAPHFNARDMALVLADKAGVPVTLVSPSPSLESLKNCVSGNYSLDMADREYPAMVLEKGRDLLSKYAREKMAEVLYAGKNVLVFQNRRGYAGRVQCTSCGYIPSCPRCNVSLGFHAGERVLKCHYCGYVTPYEGKCPSCQQEIVSVQGFGTERLASALTALFPEYPVSILDSDRHDKFDRNARIVVGTSYMIRHDEDLRNIGLVLAANADNLLTGTDFRVEEKAFRTLMTLRMTAKENQAEFIVQTRDFRQPIFNCLVDSSFTDFINGQLQQRLDMDFPPYSRLVRLEFRHQDSDYLRRAVESLHTVLTTNVPDCNISPVFEPDVERIDMEYILQIVIRFRRDREGIEQKKTVVAIVAKASDDILKKIRVSLDVDPQ